MRISKAEELLTSKSCKICKFHNNHQNMFKTSNEVSSGYLFMAIAIKKNLPQYPMPPNNGTSY